MEVLDKIAKKIFANLPLIFGAGILFMDIVAISAPIFAHFGFTSIAHIIYSVYGFLCHQRPWRSLHLFDYQVAWCVRDTFTYLSMALAVFLVVKFKIRGIKWYVPLICILPFAFDGTLQLIAEIRGVIRVEQTFFYTSTNLLRMLTGTIFGAGAGLWIFGLLDETIEEELDNNSKLKIKNFKFRNLYYFVLILVICFISYLGLVQVWRITSQKYKPSGLLDNSRYFPGVNYENTDRKGHSI